MNGKVRTRFAPSPTGFMHIGNLRTCLYAYLFAKKEKGTFILRIEDTDRERYVEGAVDLIYRTLETAGIKHDEGPDVGGNYGPYIQSQRKEMYLEYAKELVKKGGAYYCFCSKERLESLTDENGNRKYDKHCLSLSEKEVQERLSKGEKFVIRQNIPQKGESSYDDMVFGHISVKNEDMEDNILIKSDLMPTYNFANVIDDHTMGITHVIRGMEYLSSTPKYNLIYDAFGWERPKYIHLPPIMKDANRKLSKRYGDANFEDFIEKGYLPEAIVNYIALLGWSPKNNVEIMSMQELIEHFSVDGISHSPSIFDEEKMKWMNGEYIKKLTPEEFVKRSISYFERSKIKGKYDYTELAKLLITRVSLFGEIEEKVNFLEEFESYDPEWFDNKKMKCDKELSLKIIKESEKELKKLDGFDEEKLQCAVEKIAEKAEAKKGQVYLTLRLAVTGKQSTPGGGVEMCNILGKEESLKRLEFSRKLLENTLKN